MNHVNHKLYVQTFTVTKHTHSESCESQAVRTNIYSHKQSVTKLAARDLKQGEIHKRLKTTHNYFLATKYKAFSDVQGSPISTEGTDNAQLQMVRGGRKLGLSKTFSW